MPFSEFPKDVQEEIAAYVKKCMSFGLSPRSTARMLRMYGRHVTEGDVEGYLKALCDVHRVPIDHMLSEGRSPAYVAGWLRRVMDVNVPEEYIGECRARPTGRRNAGDSSFSHLPDEHDGFVRSSRKPGAG
jgi:hypothetical protein